jgi:plastocyanin
MYTPSLLVLGAALAAAEVFTVEVGDGGLVFEPKTLTVKTGDTVIFELYPQHNVITGPFSSPCTPTEGDGGFYSGPFSETDNGKKKFVVNVTSEDAMYYYCSVQKHCENGMVGGWNLP